jgi:pentatricopeptide repeat protein
MNSHSYNALIYANAKNYNIEAALKLVEEMVERKVGRTIYTYNALLAGYAFQPDDKGVQNVLMALKEERIQPTVGTYALLMDISAQQNRFENILKFLTLLLKDDALTHLDNWSVANALRLLSNHPDIEVLKTAFQACKQTTKYGKLVLNARSWSAYISGLLRYENIPDAKAAVRDMVESGVWPNERYLREILSSFWHTRNVDEYNQVLEYLEAEVPMGYQRALEEAKKNSKLIEDSTGAYEIPHDTSETEIYRKRLFGGNDDDGDDDRFHKSH